MKKTIIGNREKAIARKKEKEEIEKIFENLSDFQRLKESARKDDFVLEAIWAIAKKLEKHR